MSKRSGFTLIELMIVVIIMAALAGMVLPRLLDRADDAKINISKGEIASITMALKFYKLDNGTYPSGLSELMTKPASAKNWKGPYLEKAAVDPWSRPYKYKFKGEHNPTGFDLSSDGPDLASSEDDVDNWSD
ncbi:MAG: type II secretion system major pseudopilin GspG [Verrucomicrobia bacterium]|jgi:general secretion pathway protein G|nr:type II secretion system major pseudopilin GspG [Verrucomicrobiota bacterium]